ncbi:MAG: tryptophan--tRNA ligase [Candidatus Micrarchaeia archaeon]
MQHIDPFDVSDEEINYQKLIEEFGTQPISTIKKLPNYKAFRRGFVFSHRDFDKFLSAIEKGDKASIITGVNASGSLHLGHKWTMDLVVALQKEYNLPVLLTISDDEAYVTGKTKDQKESLENAKLIAAQLLALGFDPKKTRILIHQQYTKIYNLAIKLSRHCTMNEIKAIYGFDMSKNPGQWFYPVVQAADILLPQELEGPHHVLVPIAIDQDPHLRLARDIADRAGFIKPATVHMRFLRGLKGGSKMSKSKPGSAIFLDEDPKKAAKLCMQALTGGQPTVEEQRKYGGDPEKSVVIEYLGAHFIESDSEFQKLKDDYRAGKILDGETKQLLAFHVEKYLNEFQPKVKKYLESIDDYLMKD